MVKARDITFVGGIQEDLGSEHIRAEKESRIHDSAGVVGLGREIYNDVRFFFLEYCSNGCRIGDIPLNKMIPIGVIKFDVSEIVEIASIREEIKVDDMVTGMFVKPISDEVTPDKSRAAGDKKGCHGCDDCSVE